MSPDLLLRRLRVPSFVSRNSELIRLRALMSICDEGEMRNSNNNPNDPPQHSTRNIEMIIPRDKVGVMMSKYREPRGVDGVANPRPHIMG